MSHRPAGPACGNNPNYRMSDGDRQAVAEFRAYLADRAASRKQDREVLAERTPQPKETDGPRTVCVCGHTRAEHVIVGGPFGRGRLLCDECDGLSAEACKEFEAL